MSLPFVLRVRRTAYGYRLHVEGEATLRRHPALFELFVVQILDQTPYSVVVDLTGCAHVDDRFLGTLFDLDRHYGWPGAGRFAVVMRQRAERPLDDGFGDEVELPALEPGSADLESHLLGWHGLLARLGEPGDGAEERDDEPAALLACR